MKGEYIVSNTRAYFGILIALLDGAWKVVLGIVPLDYNGNLYRRYMLSGSEKFEGAQIGNYQSTLFF